MTFIMNKDFSDKVRKLVESTSSDVRRSMKPKIDRLLTNGVTSFATLFEVIRNPNVQFSTRISAIWLAGQLRNKSARNSLMVGFLDSDMEIVWESAISLGLIKSKAVVPNLLKELKDDTRPKRRAAAAYALGLIGDKRAESVLVEIMDRSREASIVRSHVAEALGRLNSKMGISSLKKGLTDSSEDVVFSSVYSLGQIGGIDSIQALEIFLKTSSKAKFSSARKEALRILEQ